MGNTICTSDAEASSLESMVLELEYLHDQAPEAGAKRVPLLRQELRLDMPLRVPHSKSLFLSSRVLTEKDMSDLSISSPSPSNHSIMFGLVTCD